MGIECYHPVPPCDPVIGPVVVLGLGVGLGNVVCIRLLARWRMFRCARIVMEGGPPVKLLAVELTLVVSLSSTKLLVKILLRDWSD